MKKTGRILIVLVCALLLICCNINTLADSESKYIVFVVNHNADFKLYEKPYTNTSGAIHYVPFEEINPQSVTTGEWLSEKNDTNKYDKYVFDITDRLPGYCSFRLSEPGKITQAGWLKSENTNDPDKSSDFYDLTNPDPLNNDNRIKYDPSKNESKTYYDDGILTNANADGSSSIDLKSGEIFQLKSYRTWQIVDSTAGNYVIEPDFHYSIIQGDSVVVSDTGLITAVKKGMSIIRVVYDEISVGYLGDLMKYNAVDPICVGIVVVNVDGTENESLNTGIELTEYDTVYYSHSITSPTGDIKDTGNTYAEYTFTPDIGSKVEVLSAPKTEKAINGEWTSEWTLYEADENGSYTVRLYDGKNILCVENNGMKKYHVLRASGLDATIINKSSAGKELVVGDTASVSFDNLYLPVPKMAAIYNPGNFSYTSTGFPRVQYKLGGSLYQGTQNPGDQYNLRNTNNIDIEVEESGELLLTNGAINEPYMGSPRITHYNIPEDGLVRNFSAVAILKNYSILPDIQLEVYDKELIPEDKKNKVDKINSPVPESTDTIPTAKNFIRTNYGDSISRDLTSGYVYGSEIDQSSIVTAGINRSFALKGKCYNDDVNVIYRYWREGETNCFIQESSKASFDFSGKDVKLSASDDTFENVELIIIPNDKMYTPFTYAFKVKPSVSPLNYANILPYFLNIEAVPSNGKEYYNEYDGELKADNVSLDIDGKTTEVDLGYGFLATESSYTMNLPQSTEDITLKFAWFRSTPSLSNEYITAKITVEGNDSYSQICKGPEMFSSNSTISEPIPLNDIEDTIIHIYVSSTEKNYEHLSSEYVIKVRKHSDILKQKVVFDSEMRGISLSLKNSDGKAIAIDEDMTCLLKNGQYLFEASYPGFSTFKGSFTVDCSSDIEEQIVEIPLLDGPRAVTFQCDTKDAVIIVKDARKRQIIPDNGVYSLIGGDTYIYYVSADGYLTLKKTFIVGDNQEELIEIPSLTKAPDLGRGNTVSVSIVGDESKLMNVVSVPMNLTAEEMDLVTDKSYAEYNLGTYTALHALIYALEDAQGLDYTCRKGKLKVITEMAGTYPNGSWVCEVNGIPVDDPSLYPVKANDQIVFYYDKGYAGMTHALFNEPMYEITEGDSLTLTLYGHEIGTGSDDSGLAGASIYVNQKKAGITDASGSITLKGLTMTGGPYVVTAKKENAYRQNILTFNQCMISVQSKTENISGSQTVRFRLIGDSLHGDAGHGTYQTWIATEEIPLASGTNTVYDIFMKAIKCAGLKQDGGESGYIRMVQAPQSLGGFELREFDNGSSSGWMYTLNGTHPQLGVLEQTVKEGDVIVFHYVDNFHIEENSYTWLEALDENPADVQPFVIQNTINLITNLPAASGLTLKDKAAVEEAVKAYNALTDRQKEQVTVLDASAEKKLYDAEAQISKLQRAEDDKKAASTIESKPDAIAATTVAKKNSTQPVDNAGKKVTVGNLKYKVTSVKAKSRTVTVTGMKNKKKTSVKIPATIKINKVSFKVTAVANNAFKGSKKLKTVTIGKNVKTIGKNTFKNCNNLNKITVSTKVLKKVGAGSLKGINKKAVIKVPAKKLKAYKKLLNKKGQAKTVRIIN